MLHNCFTMLFSCIPLMILKTVLREFYMQLFHEVISVYFCNNGCGCHRKYFRVPVYNRLLWDVNIRYWKPSIYEKEVIFASHVIPVQTGIQLASQRATKHFNVREC